MAGWVCGILATEMRPDLAGRPPGLLLLSALAGSGAALPWILRRWLWPWPLVPVTWLLINCLIAAFWTEINFPAMQFPPSLPPMLLMLVWMPLLAFISWSAIRRRGTARLCSALLVLASLVVAWEAPHIGQCVRILRQEQQLLSDIREAMAVPENSQGRVAVDRTEDPPQRAAIFWIESHGDVNGVIYDPTGAVVDRGKVRSWLDGAHAWHLFGPWYGFAN
jgi:hypothetical protein